MIIEGLIIAAGFSSRMGSFKAELDFGNKKLLDLTIGLMQDFCSRIVVVGGYKIEKIRELTAKYSNVKVVNNKNYKAGMFCSIKTGVQEIKGDYFFYTPCDYPLITKDIYTKLLHANQQNQLKNINNIFIPKFKERKGHPVFFDRNVIPCILQEPDNSNLKAVINQLGFKTVEVDDDCILFDIDTMEDYQKAYRKYKLKNK